MCAGQRSDRGLRRGTWRKSLGGTPMKADGSDEPGSAVMVDALSQVLARMANAHGGSPTASEDGWGE
jgi:hypothetical protein